MAGAVPLVVTGTGRPFIAPFGVGRLFIAAGLTGLPITDQDHAKGLPARGLPVIAAAKTEAAANGRTGSGPAANAVPKRSPP